MNNTYNGLKSPGGMRSYLTGMASELKEIEDRVAEVFKLWGYQKVITPTLEYYDSLTIGMGAPLKKELYKFIDYEGNILALRPEMTAPIARTLAGRVDELSFPQRLSYNASVFRYGQPQSGKNREIYQMGIELVGKKDALADAEAVIIAVESLIAAGVKDFKIDVGHTGFLEGLMDAMELTSEERNRLKTFLVQRDLVGLRTYLENLGIEDNVLLDKLPLLRGDEKVLDLAVEITENRQSREAVAGLAELYHYLSDYNLQDYVNFDLTLIRGLDYYTGVVFEGFTEKLGYTICGGGRYDNLISQYCGRDIPAIGFAIGTERVRLALKKQDFLFPVNDSGRLVIFNKASSKPALGLVKRIRTEGKTVIVDLVNQISLDLLKTYIEQGITEIISFCKYQQGIIEIYHLPAVEKEVILSESNWEEDICQRL